MTRRSLGGPKTMNRITTEANKSNASPEEKPEQLLEITEPFQHPGGSKGVAHRDEEGEITVLDRKPDLDNEAANDEHAKLKEKRAQLWATADIEEEHKHDLPPSPEEYGSYKALLEETEEHLRTHAELPDARHYRLLAGWILSTWVREDFDTATQIILRGPHESGKTRVLRLAKQLAYRGYAVTYATQATVYRLIEGHGVTLILDEAEGLLSDPLGRAVVNSGYKRGMKVPKADGPGFEVNDYSPFGPKVFASTETPEELSTSSRAIFIDIRAATRDIPMKIDGEKVEELRAKLLRFRLEELGSFEDYDALDVDSNRVREIYSPLLAVTDGDEELETLARETDEEKRKAKLDTEEALVLKALMDAYDGPGCLRLSAIRKEVPEDRLEELGGSKAWQNRRISEKLEDLGFEKFKERDQHGRFYELDTEALGLLRERARQFGLSSSSTQSEL